MKTDNNTPTFFIVAGEVSGDFHGGKLIEAIKKINPETRLVGHGGNKMQSAGLELIHHTDEMAIMGFSEVVKRLPFLLNVMGESLGELRRLRPDRIILIDYPGFNLRLAKNSHKLNIPITYFILPQLWAWKENRIKYFHQFIDQSLSIFPFEPDWFQSRGVKTEYVGHPFSEITGSETPRDIFYKKHNIKTADRILLLLPGSRQQEIDYHLEVYIDAAREVQKSEQDIKILIGKAPGVSMPDFGGDILVESDDIRSAINYSTAAVTTSGTASLECAVLDTPEVVCYKLSRVSGFLAKRLSKTQYVSMANLISGREIVPELLQNEVKPQNIAKEIKPLINSTNDRRAMLDGFSEVRRTLGLPGVYDRAAGAILKRTTYGKP